MTWASPRGPSCAKCSGGPQPGTAALLAALIDSFDRTRSMGIYNCRPVAGTTTMSQHACGRACDLGVPTLSGGKADTSIGDSIVRALFDAGLELGVTCVIYNRVIYTAAYPKGRAYGGVHPHYDHLHIEQTPAKSESLTYAQATAALNPIPDPPTEDDMSFLNVVYGDGTGARQFKRADVAVIQNLINDAGYTPRITADGIYDARVSTALQSLGVADPKDGRTVNGNTYARLWRLAVARIGGDGGLPAKVTLVGDVEITGTLR